jgi:hypothetical protein
MSKIWRGFDEDELRELIREAVSLARRTSVDNMCDDAIVQRVMKEEFIDGRWRSKLFIEQYETTMALESLTEIFERRKQEGK